MNRRIIHLLLTGLLSGLISACGGRGNDGPPTDTVVPPELTYAVTGIVAAGTAQMDARMDVFDARGVSIDVGQAVTDVRGRYRFRLPATVGTPILVRTVLADGEEVTTLLPKVTTPETIGHVNPVTDLLTRRLLGTPPETSSVDGFAAASSNVDESLEAVGDELVRRLFGLSVRFRDFASRPDYVARSPFSAGSGTDTLLDVADLAADQAGQSLSAYLRAAADEETYQPLLGRIESLAQLIALRVLAGVEAAELAEDLRSFGAWPEDEGAMESELFGVLTSRLPSLITALQQDPDGRLSVPDTGNNDGPSADELTWTGLRILIDTLSRSLATRTQAFEATPANLDDLLANPGYRDALLGVVPTISRWLSTVRSAPPEQGFQQLTGVEKIAPLFSHETGLALAALDYSQTGIDFSNLVSNYLDARFGDVNASILSSIGTGGSADHHIDAAADLPSLLDLLTTVVDTGSGVVLYPRGRWGRDPLGYFRWD